MSPLVIHLADKAGFCWGVERALRLAQQAAATAERPIHTLGPLIHNPAVVEELAEQGITVVDDPDIESAGTVIIRSHGVPQGTTDALTARGVTVVDATCTFVKAAQDKAARLRNEGYRVVILGEATHPEVYAIHSYAGPDALVVEDPADLPDDLPRGKVGIVVQTTQSRERLGALVQAILPRVRELRVFNTICDATEKRQEAAVALARTVELVLVVGGRNSGNTTRLAELCAAVQPNTRHIEAPTEILPEWVEGIDTVGVTAGASTPQKQIDAVVARLGQLVP